MVCRFESYSGHFFFLDFFSFLEVGLSKVSMYLAGKIQKGHEDPKEFYWHLDDLETLKKYLHPIVPTFLNPAERSDDLSDQKSVFGRDMLQVFSSDLVLVDARARRGLGVGAEMMWAKMNRMPVISWAPKDTHYHHTNTTLLGASVENWIHPFVESLSDRLVENLEEAAEALRAVVSQELAIKGPECIHQAMEHYKKSNLGIDLPMQELLEECSSVKKRALSLSRN